MDIVRGLVNIPRMCPICMWVLVGDVRFGHSEPLRNPSFDRCCRHVAGCRSRFNVTTSWQHNLFAPILQWVTKSTAARLGFSYFLQIKFLLFFVVFYWSVIRDRICRLYAISPRCREIFDESFSCEDFNELHYIKAISHSLSKKLPAIILQNNVWVGLLKMIWFNCSLCPGSDRECRTKQWCANTLLCWLLPRTTGSFWPSQSAEWGVRETLWHGSSGILADQWGLIQQLRHTWLQGSSARLI